MLGHAAPSKYLSGAFDLVAKIGPSTTTTRLGWWLHPVFTAGGAASFVGAARGDQRQLVLPVLLPHSEMLPKL